MNALSGLPLQNITSNLMEESGNDGSPLSGTVMDPRLNKSSSTEDEDVGVDSSNSIDHVFSLNEYMKSNHELVDNDQTDNELPLLEFEEEGTGSEKGMNPDVTSLKDDKNGKSTDKSIQLVEYNHDGKPQRLGRRRPLKQAKVEGTDGLSGDSGENEEKSKYMLYRLDDLPVEGPGSRGGKPENRNKRGKITSESLRKRKQKQSQLTFGKNTIEITKKEVETAPLANKKSNLPNEPSAQEKAFKEHEKTVKKGKENVKASKPPAKKSGRKKIIEAQPTTTSRTTVLANVHKITRQFPGPIIPLCYDLYDDNMMNMDLNKSERQEKIALGYDVKPAPYAGDIMFIISFCTKFKDIIGLGKFGPQDIEEGLSLDNLEQPTDVSPLMNDLFARLVTLVLNRKPDVNPRYQGKAVSELKAVCVSLGLPREWKDKNEVYKRVTIDNSNAEVVDESKPEILLNEGYVFQPPFVYENPFNDKNGFEKYGFNGIANPVDRLIMLRTLAQWSLASSTAIKAAIQDLVLKQDVPGDKETFYASRALLKGFKHTEDLTTDINNKIAKKNYSEDNELVARYVEPIADPLEHSLRFRVDEMVVGDLGFNVGRFYMCRISDSKDGGLTSVSKMKQAWNSTSMTRSSFACRFKLYVQDVHALLVERLEKEGVEFDDKGEEVTILPDDSEYLDCKLYEVASNATEFNKFIDYLGNRLGLSETPENVIAKTSPLHNPASCLYEYLSGIKPLIEQQDVLVLEERSLRKRTVDYSDGNASKKLKSMSDTYEEADEQYDQDFEELDLPPEDDEEDDDYME